MAKRKWNGHTPFIKGHKLRVGLKHSEQFKEGRKTTGNAMWKGDGVSVRSLHCWVRDNFTKSGQCIFCGKIGGTDWSNKFHTYKRTRDDWQELCRGCHLRYDYKQGFRKRRQKANRLQKEGMESFR